ncbi:MAG: SBBP repeat-containing protein [bacterium]|nr:SBBP repeat-containing protein [bacterium]
MKKSWILATAAVIIIAGVFTPYTKVHAIVDLGWAIHQPGPAHGDDSPVGVEVDASGNVYVVGHSYHDEITGYDYLTIKYTPDGAVLWRSYYDSPSENSWDVPMDFILNDQGNVYITGECIGDENNLDFATVCFNSQGRQLWEAIYAGPNQFNDEAQALALDAAGNLYVTGRSYTSVDNADFATIKYNSLGEQQWVALYNGPGNRTDYPVDIAVDGTGNVYVTGNSDSDPSPRFNYDFATIKYNSMGVQQWVVYHNGPYNGNDYPVALALDGDANVYVTGQSQNASNSDCITVKYNSNGVQQWVHGYTETQVGYPIPFSMKLDRQNNVVIAGCYSGETGSKYFTLKLNSAGVQQWARLYQSSGTWGERANAVAVDRDLNVYVTGESHTSSWFPTCTTLKYDQAGTLKWTAYYDSDLDALKSGVDLAIDRHGNVLVAAQFMFMEQADYDFLTLKYHQVQGDVAVGMIPTVSPIQIPPTGGSFSYHLTTVNGVRDSLPVDLWWQINFPGLYPRVVNIGLQSRDLPLDTCVIVRTQNVSANVPAGTYQYAAYIGDFPEIVWASDTLTFEKQSDSSDPWVTTQDESFSGPFEETEPATPTQFELLCVFPNPFNPSTTISYALPTAGLVNLSVYDISGKKVVELVNGTRDAGKQEVTFDGSNLPSGIYFCRLQAGVCTAVEKMVLLK